MKNFWTLGVADGWWLIKLIWVAQNKVVLLYTGPGSKIKPRRKRAIWFGEQLMKGTISTLLFVCLFVCLKENVSPLIVFAVMFYLLCNLQLFVCGTKWLYRGTKWLSCGTKWLFFGTKWLGTKWLWNEVTGYPTELIRSTHAYTSQRIHLKVVLETDNSYLFTTRLQGFTNPWAEEVRKKNAKALLYTDYLTLKKLM